MFLHIAGTLLVMAGSAGLGMYFSVREGFRARDLAEFKKALMILSSEVGYMRAALPEACANIAKRTAGEVSHTFARFTELISQGDGETAYQLWLDALQPCHAATHLTAEDFTVLEDFGKTLGYLDKQMQKNAIDFAVAYIDEKCVALATSNDKNKRMYRGLGVICGLMISVVLW